MSTVILHSANDTEWKENRKNGIGASDASCILGVNPWKTNVQLWEEKTGRRIAEDISDKAVVQYGKQAETFIRSLFALNFPQYTVTYDEFGMISQSERPWLFATLDGELTEAQRKGVLEIKTTEIMRSGDWHKWNGRIPDYYFTQVLHQLLATGYDFAVLTAQIKQCVGDGIENTKFFTRHYQIERSEVLSDMQYLLEKEVAFWECVQKDTPPNLILPQI